MWLWLFIIVGVIMIDALYIMFFKVASSDDNYVYIKLKEYMKERKLKKF